MDDATLSIVHVHPAERVRQIAKGEGAWQRKKPDS